MGSLALPTRRDEAWRYSDLAAVADLWPVAAEALDVPAGTALARTIVVDDAGPAIAALDATVGAGATLTLHLAVIGESYGRIAVDVTLGDGARLEIGGVVLARGGAAGEIVTTVRHAQPNATSRQIIRSVVDDRASATFLGKVAVARGAQKSDAVQSVKALLLSRTATANAKPELEIFADDVKCAHGATVGELDANALFYMASRGIAEAEAKALLTEAFVADALAGAPDLAERAVAWLRA